MTQIPKGVKIVSDKEAEECTYIVCMPWDDKSPFADNLKGTCCECGCTVMYRWHAPRKPKRICMDCMMKQVETENKNMMKQVGTDDKKSR